MMQFWMLAAALILVAAAFIVFPLFLRGIRTEAEPVQEALNLELYRQRLQDLAAEHAAGELDDAGFAALKLETERALLEEAAPRAAGPRRTGARWLPLAAAILLLPTSLGLYQLWGAAPRLALTEQLQQTPKTREEMLAWLAAMEQGLGPQPPAEQLYNLARSYQSLRELTEAERLYRRLLEQAGPQAELYAQLAQLRFMQAGNPLDAPMGEYLDRALALDGDNMTALGLAGIRAFEGADYPAAVAYWGRALELEPDGEGAEALKLGIARARVAQASVAEDSAATTTPSAALRRIELRVEAPEAVELPASARVFVFAKASTGPAMPLAVSAFSARELPRTLVLDSSMAMTEGMSLDDFDQVDLIARVSLSGDVKSADYEARYANYRFTEHDPVTLQLKAVQP